LAEFSFQNNPQGLDLNVDSGAFYVFKTGEHFPEGIVRDCAQLSSFCFASTVPQSRYSSSVAFLDFNGDNVLDVLLGAPRDHTLFENSGSAGLFLSFFEPNLEYS